MWHWRLGLALGQAVLCALGKSLAVILQGALLTEGGFGFANAFAQLHHRLVEVTWAFLGQQLLGISPKGMIQSRGAERCLQIEQADIHPTAVSI